MSCNGKGVIFISALIVIFYSLMLSIAIFIIVNSIENLINLSKEGRNKTMLTQSQGLILIRNKDTNIIEGAYIDTQLKSLVQGLNNVKIETVETNVKVYSNCKLEIRRI